MQAGPKLQITASSHRFASTVADIPSEEEWMDEKRQGEERLSEIKQERYIV